MRQLLQLHGGAGAGPQPYRHFPFIASGAARSAVCQMLDSYMNAACAERKETAFSLVLPGPDGALKAYYESLSQRMKVFDVTPDQFVGLQATLEVGDAANEGYTYQAFTKLILYSRPGYDDQWERLEAVNEGVIEGFFRDGDHAEIWSFFMDEARATANCELTNHAIIRLALSKEMTRPTLAEGYRCRAARVSDAPEIVCLMRHVFGERYPAMISPDAIAGMIAEQSNHFRIVRDADGTLASVASAELDHPRRTAEMGECATHPDHRKKGLMTYILWQIEQDIYAEYDIDHVFALARANQPGVNCAFRKLGYEYNGRLCGHSRMPTGLESMNIWCKPLQISLRQSSCQ